MISAEAISKVGILIPTYNRKEYLEKALTSAQGQIFRDVEIIVIDNGSSDGTDRLMATLNDPRVRYIVNSQNLGLLGSINKGVRLFSPEVAWCTILPDDDLLDDNFIASLVAAQAQNSAESVIHGRRVLIDGAGEVMRRALSAPEIETAFDYLLNRTRRKRETFLTGVFFSRRAFEAIGGYPQFATGMATDDAFIFALSLLDRLVYVEKAVSYVRMHEGAESHDTASCRHLAALVDFRNYMLQAVEKYAKAGNERDERMIASVPRLLEKYISLLASSFWIRDVKHIVKHEENYSDVRIAELCGVAARTDVPFSLRVKASIAIRRRFGLFPESYLMYRAFWEAVDKIATTLW